MKDFNFEIWRMQSGADVKGLVATLKDPNPFNRRGAAMALRSLGTPAAIPGVQDALLRESDPELRELLVLTLETLFAQNNDGQAAPQGDNRNVVRLIARLSGTHTEQAVRAAQELGESREKLTIEALLLTFNNHNMAPRVRLAVAEALLKLQSAPAEITLLAALRSERWMIRRNAAGVLGQLQADWAVDPLIQTLRDPIEAVRRVSRAALERIGTPEALAAIRAPEVPADDAPPSNATLVYDKPVGTPIPALTPVDKPAPPAVTRERPAEVLGKASPPADAAPKPSVLADAILDEPPPSEEDTKPIRPLPDDVS